MIEVVCVRLDVQSAGVTDCLQNQPHPVAFGLCIVDRLTGEVESKRAPGFPPCRVSRPMRVPAVTHEVTHRGHEDSVSGEPVRGEHRAAVVRPHGSVELRSEPLRSPVGTEFFVAQARNCTPPPRRVHDCASTEACLLTEGWTVSALRESSPPGWWDG